MKSKPIRYFIAIALICLGTMLALDNLGILESDVKELWHYVYPLFFIVFGCTLLFHYFKYKRPGFIFGLFLIIFGVLLILGRMEFIAFEFFDIFKLWPLLIVFIGFSLVRKSKNNKSYSYIYNSDENYWENKNWGRFSVGNFEYTEPNWKVKPMNLYKAAGDFYFDFTKAFIPDEEIPITINSWAGDVHILLPEELDVRITSKVKAGEISLFGKKADGVIRDLYYESPNYESATKKLDIIIDLKAGSIRVDKV